MFECLGDIRIGLTCRTGTPGTDDSLLYCVGIPIGEVGDDHHVLGERFWHGDVPGNEQAEITGLEMNDE